MVDPRKDNEQIHLTVQTQFGLRCRRGECKGVMVGNTVVFMNDRWSSVGDRKMVFQGLPRSVHAATTPKATYIKKIPQPGLLLVFGRPLRGLTVRLMQATLGRNPHRIPG